MKMMIKNLTFSNMRKVIQLMACSDLVQISFLHILNTSQLRWTLTWIQHRILAIKTAMYLQF